MSKDYVEFGVTVSNVFARNNQKAAYKRDIRRGGPRYIYCQEAQNLGGMKGYRKFTGNKDKRSRGVAIFRDVQGGRLLSSTSQRLTKDAGGYSHARWVTIVRDIWQGEKLAHICVHANPAHRGAGAAENAKLMQRLARIITRLEKAGYHVIVGGDWNRVWNDHGPDTPRWLANRCNLKASLFGIDGLLFSQSIELVSARPGNATGSNHDLIRYRFRIKKG